MSVTTNTGYTKLGDYTVVPAADLLDLQSSANCPGDTRQGARSLGKRAGMKVLRDSSGSLSEVFALGSKSSDAWRLVDGSASYTPVGISSWTVGADSTYSSGLLTTDGGNDAAGRASQAIALSAGTFRISGQAAFEGTGPEAETPNYVAPRIRVGTSAGDTTYKSIVVGKDEGHPTAAESADPKGVFDFTITVPTAGNVYITIDIVDEAAALAAGSAYIAFNALEAYPV